MGQIVSTGHSPKNYYNAISIFSANLLYILTMVLFDNIWESYKIVKEGMHVALDSTINVIFETCVYGHKILNAEK